ncbi:MAG: hypothetical protein ACJ8FS_05190 [Sphingomicrobium sp.]
MASKNKIPAKNSIRLLDSVAFLNSYYGAALNGMITVNFQQLGLTSEKDSANALTKLNEALADKIGRYGRNWNYYLPHQFVYVHEYVQSHGHHAHELLVVPKGLGAELHSWLTDWADRNYPGSDPDAVRFGARYPKDLDKRAIQQRNLVRYVLKSTEDACIHGLDGEPTTLHTILGITDKHERAYCATVRRVTGSSENIANRAQLRGGFWPPQHLETVLTDRYLRNWQAGRQADELWRMLNSIDI